MAQHLSVPAGQNCGIDDQLARTNASTICEVHTPQARGHSSAILQRHLQVFCEGGIWGLAGLVIVLAVQSSLLLCWVTAARRRRDKGRCWRMNAASGAQNHTLSPSLAAGTQERQDDLAIGNSRWCHCDHILRAGQVGGN